MITHSERTRRRRQMYHRIRIVLAQRRVDASAAVRSTGQQPAGGAERRSGEPPPQH